METALLVRSAQLYMLEFQLGELLIPLCTDKCIFLAKMSQEKEINNT